eukprot:1551504-Amphidinium_carterae.1
MMEDLSSSACHVRAALFNECSQAARKLKELIRVWVHKPSVLTEKQTTTTKTIRNKRKTKSSKSI